MTRKAVPFACATSFVLCGVSAVLFVVSFAMHPKDDRVSFTDEFHVSLSDGRVFFFSDSDMGPYCGGIIQLSDGSGDTPSPFEREVTWGDSLGVYYRYFRDTDPTIPTLWTLAVSLLWPVGIFGWPSVFCLCLCWLRRRDRRAATLAHGHK